MPQTLPAARSRTDAATPTDSTSRVAIFCHIGARLGHHHRPTPRRPAPSRKPPYLPFEDWLSRRRGSCRRSATWTPERALRLSSAQALLWGVGRMQAEGAPAMILPKVRDPRFVTIRRGGTLTDSDHRLLALWATSCAEHVIRRRNNGRVQGVSGYRAGQHAGIGGHRHGPLIGLPQRCEDHLGGADFFWPDRMHRVDVLTGHSAPAASSAGHATARDATKPSPTSSTARSRSRADVMAVPCRIVHLE